jgi:hypothetical protein
VAVQAVKSSHPFRKRPVALLKPSFQSRPLDLIIVVPMHKWCTNTSILDEIFQGTHYLFVVRAMPSFAGYWST